MSSKSFKVIINLAHLASDPETGRSGDVYYNTTSNYPKYFNGTVWTTFGSGGTAGVTTFNTRSGDITLTDSDVNTALGYTAASSSDISSAINALTTSDIEEGTNLYYTNERAQDAIGNNLGTGLQYNDSTGAISIKPRAYSGIGTNGDGEFFVDGYYVTYNEGAQTLKDKTIDAQYNTITVTSSNVSDFAEAAQDAVGNSVGTGLTYTDSTGAISVDTTTIQARVSGVSDTEIGYLDGVTSGIQSQINSKAPINSPTFTGTVVLPNSTVTNAMLAGSIDNNKLSHSSITINGYEIALGGTASYSTDNIDQGTTNLYFSNELAQDAIGNNLGTGLSYNDTTGAISVNTSVVQARVSGVSDTEIGYLDGVTSGIQSQIDSKAPIASASLTGTTQVENLEISGALTFVGTATQIDQTNLAVTDSLIYLADEQFASDVLDIGIYGAYGEAGGDSENHLHTGLFRDATDKKWKLISGGSEPTDSIIDLTGVAYDTLVVDSVEGNLIGTADKADKSLINYDDTTSHYFPILWADNSTVNKGPGYYTLYQTVDQLAWNPDTQVLSAPNISGNLTGNVTGNAGTVTNGIYTTTTSLPNVTSVNSTSIPASKTLLVSTDIGSSVQAWDGDLDAIAAISGASGLLKKTAANTWSLDTNTYLTTSSASSTYLTISNAATTYVSLAGSYSNPTWITGLAWSKISSTPTTLSGYGITDALSSSTAASTYLTQSSASSTYLTQSSASSTYQPLDSDLTAIAGLATGTGLLKNTAGTWSLDTNSYLTTSSASSTYLTQSNAASTYLPLTGGTISSDLTITGNLTINGTTTTINSTTISVDDKNIELGSVTSPTDTTADGGGITLKGTTDKTINWINSTGRWTSNVGFEASSFVKTGGSSSQFLKADGSTDSSTYLTSSTGVTTVNGNSGAISNIAVTNADNSFSSPQTISPSSTSASPLSIVSASGNGSNIISLSRTGGNSLVVDNTARLVASAGGTFGSSTAGSARLNVYTGSSTTLGLVVATSAGANQFADLQQWQNSAGTSLAGVNPAGQIYSGSTISKLSTNTIALTSAAYTSSSIAVFTYNLTSQVIAIGQKITIAGVTGGTYNGSWTVIGFGGTSGAFTFTVAGSGFTNVSGSGGTAQISPTASFVSNTTATTALVIQAAASQTVNLLEVQNSSGSNLLSVNSTGALIGTLGASSTTTLSSNSTTAIDTVALSNFTTIKYVVSIKQGTKIRSSEVLVQTDGTSVNYVEYGTMTIGSALSGFAIAAAVSSTNMVLNITITDAASTNATIKLNKVVM